MILRSMRVVTPMGVGPAAIHVTDGKISRVGDYRDAPGDVLEYGNLVIMPGLVDSHVHVNEPGRTEWEGFETATRAAAAGGVTTIADMPLNSIPPTTSVEALLAKAQALEGKAWVDVALWGGAVPGNEDELLPLLDEGALGFKCFLVDSGVPEFPPLSSPDLISVAEIVRDSGAPLLVHAEAPERIQQPTNGSYDAYVRSRPAAAENDAIELLFRVSRRTHAWIHVVHLSSASALPIFHRAREAGIMFSAETTPHYLHFAAEQIRDDATEYKCAPPIRPSENRERLWQGLRDRLIDMVVTDHSPAPPEMKRGDFTSAWGGIASLQLGLAATWTEAQRRGFDLPDIVRWMCEGPAGLMRLNDRKGTIAPGFDADLVIWSPEERFRVDEKMIEHRHKLTPYAGEELLGVVKATYLRGQKVYDDFRFTGPFGTWVKP